MPSERTVKLRSTSCLKRKYSEAYRTSCFLLPVSALDTCFFFLLQHPELAPIRASARFCSLHSKPDRAY
jgi:hypothetical protein